MTIWPAMSPKPRRRLINARQTRMDMNNEPSHQAIDNEIAYRWNQEVTAMGKLSDAELEMVYKNGWKPSQYLANK